MSACLPLTLSRANSRKFFLSEEQVKENNGGSGEGSQSTWREDAGEEDLSSLSMPKKLLRSVSLKLRKLNLMFDQENEEIINEETKIDAMSAEEHGKERWAAGKCLGLYAKSVRCRVGADLGEEMVGRSSGVRKVVDDGEVFVETNPDVEEDYRREYHGCLTLDAGLERLRAWNRRDSKVDAMGKSLDRNRARDVDMAGGYVRNSLDGEEGDWSGRRERSRLECFAYGGSEKFWRRNGRKSADRRAVTGLKEDRHSSLPDDIVEMCLARASFVTLMNARLVCKKWKMLTSTNHFMQMRASCLSQRPWLFLFGLSRDGVCMGQIQALDTTMDKWHKIDADILRGRFMFSVAGAGSSVYVIGGCSSSNNSGRIDKSSYKTHKAVLVYSPLTGLWKKVAPMRAARALPIVGIFEIHSGSKGWFGHLRRRGSNSFEEDGSGEQRGKGVKLLSIQGRYGGVATSSASGSSESRCGRVSEVYGGRQKVSGRRQLWEVFQETKLLDSGGTLPCSSVPDLGKSGFGKLSEEERDQGKLKETKTFGLIVAGGQGLWNEPLDSAEIYDPISNKWREIARLPADHGVLCAGVVCNGVFYVYSESDKLAAYDFEKGTWIGIQIAHSPVRLHEYFPKLVSCRGRLFMLGVSWCERGDGENGRDKATRKLWELDLSSYSWTEISRHPDAPLDWNAAFVGDEDRIFGVEMFKIFGQVLDFVTVCDVSGPRVKWNRISREHVAQDMDPSSCMTKTAVIYIEGLPPSSVQYFRVVDSSPSSFSDTMHMIFKRTGKFKSTGNIYMKSVNFQGLDLRLQSFMFLPPQYHNTICCSKFTILADMALYPWVGLASSSIEINVDSKLALDTHYCTMLGQRVRLQCAVLKYAELILLAIGFHCIIFIVCLLDTDDLIQALTWTKGCLLQDDKDYSKYALYIMYDLSSTHSPVGKDVVGEKGMQLSFGSSRKEEGPN
eukprot:Gb_16521 [translate_table: standard]